MARFLGRLVDSTDAAVAPVVALSLFALIGAGGIAFDYARLAGLDTEVQQAADHAALAAATQLDRTDNALTRASASIQAAATGDRLVANNSRFANDAGGARVDIAAITYCSSFDDSKADNDEACTETTDPLVARFVMVTTQARTANYAFTPIVAAFRGTVSGKAVAGVQSAMCNVAPLLVCAPTGNDDFPNADDVGKGIILKPSPRTQLQWAPGNFGLLDFGNGTGAVFDALMGQGLNGCKSDDGETEPGNKDTVTDATNTRFDVYNESNVKVWDKAAKGPRCTSSGAGCPAPNTRKDMALVQTYEVKNVASSAGEPASPPCGSDGAGFPGTLTTTSEFTLSTTVKGFPRDNCHVAGNCPGGNIGKQNDWSIPAYLTANHPSTDAAAIAASLGGTKTATNLTRYDIYKWEQQDASRTAPQNGGTEASSKCTGKNGTSCDWTIKRQCAYSRPKVATTTYTAQKDRRLLPVVAANCDELKGKGGATGGFTGWNGYVLLKVFDIFLVEPSLNRTSPSTHDEELYAEIVGPAQSGGGVADFQMYSKTKPYLVR